MANAQRDANRVPTAIAVSDADGATPVLLQADPVSHGIKLSHGTTGSDLGPTNAIHDANRVPSMVAVSSVDGVTPVVLYADPSTNELLIKRT